MDYLFDFLGENWWQGIGAILAVAALIVAIRQNKKKRLSYQVLYSEPLVDIANQVKNDLKITYKDHVVDQLNILTIKIINNGGVSIRQTDFENMIELKIENAKTIISYGFSDTYPSNLNTLINHNNGRLFIAPLLLNAGEYFTIQTIFDGLDRKFTLTARIEGISEIKALVNRPFPKYTVGIMAIMMFLVILTQAILEALNAAIKLNWYLDYVFTFLITIAGLHLAQEFFFRWKNKLR
ncbi:hypothetical protein [Dyadobacter sp. BHUBP1]|uniref:hypothetical protein n=1 Tax=Dyadobacter sp. BHUBP1 TaxID=3424178 RepID=UPI003D34E5D9